MLLETGSVRILFDVGAGTIRRLLETGVSIDDISIILVSHLHLDHTGELASLLFSTKNSPRSRRTEPLTIGAAMGFRSFYNRLEGAYGGQITLEPGVIGIREFDTDKSGVLKIGPITIQSMPMVHADESIGYRVTTADNHSVVYSGDTDVCDNLVSLARDADLMICEASFPDELKADGHLTPALAGELATRANVGRLLLTHFYPQCDAADMMKQCRKTYSGSLLIAEDLMRIVL